MADQPAFQGPLTRNLQTPALNLCRLTWKGLLVNSPNTADTQEPSGDFLELDVSHRDLHEVLWQVLPKLDLVDIAFLTVNLKQAGVLKKTDELKTLFDYYGLAWNHRLKQVCEKLVDTPLIFKDWVRQKKASAKDLLPLLSHKDITDFAQSLEQIADFQASRSEGKWLLDNLTDLELAQKNGPWKSSELKSWIAEVRLKRYPLTHQRDARESLDLNLPQFAEHRKKRDGDRLLHHLSFSFRDQSEALQKIQRLQQKMQEPS